MVRWNLKHCLFFQELAKEKEDHAKVVKDLETFNSKHNTLKDFVANSMKPKITTQKNELSLRQAEIDTLRTKEKQLSKFDHYLGSQFFQLGHSVCRLQIVVHTNQLTQDNEYYAVYTRLLLVLGVGR